MYEIFLGNDTFGFLVGLEFYAGILIAMWIGYYVTILLGKLKAPKIKDVFLTPLVAWPFISLIAYASIIFFGVFQFFFVWIIGYAIVFFIRFRKVDKFTVSQSLSHTAIAVILGTAFSVFFWFVLGYLVRIGILN